MSNRPSNTRPTAAQWGQWRSFLARNGISQNQINEAIGPRIAGETRAKKTERLNAWLKVVQNDQ